MANTTAAIDTSTLNSPVDTSRRATVPIDVKKTQRPLATRKLAKDKDPDCDCSEVGVNKKPRACWCRLFRDTLDF